MSGYDSGYQPGGFYPYESGQHDKKRPLLDEDAFGPRAGSLVSAFDAFPKSKPQYVTKTSGGGKWTVAMSLMSLILLWSELSRWWTGTKTHAFAVEKGVGHSVQLNLDVVVRMPCADLHLNVQDAAGDRILAATRLRRDQTAWAHWVDGRGVHKLGRDEHGRAITGEGWHALANHDEGFGEEHVHDIVAAGRRRARWGRTPRLWGKGADSCRIYGNLDLNRVQGDFHITARGHGYLELGGQHLDHNKFNFSHIISELSFGPFLPSLANPLDRTVNLADAHFHKFQYYLSVVPTIYTVGTPGTLGAASIATNQYAVTEQSKEVSEQAIPGIFVKYDIEPILLSIVESRDGLLAFLVKIVNILSGAMVAGHWGFVLSEAFRDAWGRRRRSGPRDGVLGGKGHQEE